MKLHRNPILKAMISRVHQLREQFNESSAIEHHATRGSLREAYLKDFLATAVPHGFGICSGFISDSESTNISPQIDLLVYDKSSLPSFFMSSFCTIVPLESVRVSIEVKSTLRLEDFQQVQTQQSSIRKMRFAFTAKLRKYLMSSDCLGVSQFIVAYETNSSRDSIIKWFDEEPMLEVVCVIGKFCIYRDPLTCKVDVKENDDHYSDVMCLITRLQAIVSDCQERAIDKDIPDEGVVSFYPDYGAYLTFDIPSEDDQKR